MLRLLFVMLFGLIHIMPTTLGAQQYSAADFGSITATDFDLSKLELGEDQDADAVVLFDIGEAYYASIIDDLYLRFERVKRIRILKEDGKSYAQVVIPFYIENSIPEEVINIEAYSYNLVNGVVEKTQLDTKTIYEERINNNYKSKKFAIPNVQSSSIIEYRYTVESPFYTDIPKWYFQEQIPVQYSEFKMSTLPIFDYSFITKGVIKFDAQSSEEIILGLNSWTKLINLADFSMGRNREIVYNYVLKNVPAFKNESFITTEEDYIKQIEFKVLALNQANREKKYFTKTWEQIIKEIEDLGEFSKYLKNAQNDAKKNVIPKLDLEGKGVQEKIARIHEFMTATFEWNKEYRFYASNSRVSDFIKSKTGSAADINLYYIGALQAAGINASPMLISTRNHGKINMNFPSFTAFNYVAAFIDDEIKAYSDATQKHLNFGSLPLYAVNELGLVAADGKGTWMNTNISASSLDRRNFIIILDFENAVAKSNVTIESSSYAAYMLKNRLENDSLKIMSYLSDKGFNKVTSYATRNYESKTRSYLLNFKDESAIEEIDGIFVLKPFKGFQISTNYFKKSERNFPVDFIFPQDEQFMATISVPEGYQLIEQPPMISHDDELMSVELQFEQTKNLIKLVSIIRLKKSFYEPAEYSQLKKNFQLIVDNLDVELLFEAI